MCFPKRKCFFINIYHLGTIKGTAVKVDPFTIRHLVLSPLCSEYASNQHTVSCHHKEVGGYRKGNTNMKWWGGGRRRKIRILSKTLLTTAHQNPLLDLPETSPKEFWAGVSTEEMKSCPSGFSLEYSLSIQSTASVCLGKLLLTHQNPTQLSPFPRNVPCPTSARGNHALHSSTLASSINLCTRYTTADCLPRLKHCSKGTRDTTMNKMGKKLAVYKYIAN